MNRVAWAGLLCLLGLPAQAELSLGVLPGEPAPTVAAVLERLDGPGEPLRIVFFSSADEMIDALRAGRLDLALLEEPSAPLAGISVVSELYPSVLHAIHRDTGTAPTDVAELLTSGSVYAGAAGGVGYELVSSLARDFGVEASRVRLLADALAEDPDVYFVFGGLLAEDALQRLNGFRLWSLDDPDRLMHGSAAESLMLRYPNLRPFILPADLYPTIGRAPALTVAVTTLLVARDSLEENRVFNLATTVGAAGARIAAAYPLAGLPQLAMNDRAARTLNLHSGARRYLNRDAPGFLERYAEVLALGFSLVIALGSASVAVERRRRQSRKDRLDGFYQRVLQARPVVGATDAQRRVAEAEVRSIQTEVFDLVVRERIDADGALVAFLTLSNQVLAEARATDAAESEMTAA